MKNYSRYVASYLSKLLTQKDNIAITKEQYLLLLDAVYSNKKNFPSDLKQDLSNKLSMVMPLLFKNKKEKYSNFFELVFKKILVNSDKSYQDCLCDILINIFHEDKTTLTNWSKIYSKNVATSAILLKYLGNYVKFDKYIFYNVELLQVITGKLFLKKFLKLLLMNCWKV